MYYRYFLFSLLLLCLFAKPAFAQSTPTIAVEIVPAQAAQGDTITANVYVRNGVNIAGADVGIEVDECLRVIDRTQATYLPNSSNGGFTVFDETTDTSTRLAVAITDRTAIANTDDIFFSADLEVLCDSGMATVTVATAELSAYRDPQAEQIELVAYVPTNGTLATENGQLTIGESADGIQPSATAEIANASTDVQPTQPVETEAVGSNAPATEIAAIGANSTIEETAPTPVPEPSSRFSNVATFSPMVVVAVAVVALVGLFMLRIVLRR